MTKLAVVPEPDTRIIGYARVSTRDQNLELQIAALKKAGVRQEDIFLEKTSASKRKKRPELERAIKALHPGDIFLVWKLDRLARNVRQTLELVERIRAEGAAFKSICEDISTAGPGGTLVFHILAALAQFESDVTSFRTKAGMQNLREKGNRLGAKPKLTQAQWDKIEQLLSDTPATAKEVAAKFKVSVALIHKRFPGGKIALQRAAFRHKRKK